MNVLIIYYSLEGNTRLISEAIAKEIGADILELKPKEDIKSKGFMRYFWGGRQVVQRQKPELFPLDKDVNNYDALIIGTPVWAGSYVPAFNSFFAGTSISGKKIALFCCHGGGKGKVFGNLKKALEGNVIVDEIDFKDPLKNDADGCADKARQWARGVVSTI